MSYETYKYISELVKAKQHEKLGRVNVIQKDDLVLLDYKSACQYDGHWTDIEKLCRGLILKQDGTILAIPFPKFFNYGEKMPLTNKIKSVTKKMDGSLGILYRKDSQLKIATRGSFNSPQAEFATQELQRYNLTSLPAHITLLFEIIYPQNRIVVNYQNFSGLVLIGATNINNGMLYDYGTVYDLACKFGFNVTRQIEEFETVSDILDNLKELEGEEGYVVTFLDDTIFKFKTDWYVQLHKVKNNFGYKYVLECLEKNLPLSDLPDEFYNEANEYALQIQNRYQEIVNQFQNDIFKIISKGIYPFENRKEFAIAIKDNPLKSLIFAFINNKDYKSLIFKMLKEENRSRS